MSWKGPRGASGITSDWNLTHAIKDAMYRFGVKKEELLIGYRETPPDVSWCMVYIYYTGASIEYFIKKNSQWVNWNYS